MSLFDFSASLSCNISPIEGAMICHDRPYLSFSRPHLCFSPPAESFSQSSSISGCVSHFTKKDMPGEKVNIGHPLSAQHFWTSSRNIADITVPFGTGPAHPHSVNLIPFQLSNIEPI